jgi:plastocyanin
MLTYAGVAGAAADTTVTAVGDATEGQWDKGHPPDDPPVAVSTGDKVTFSFAGSGHNVVSTNTSGTDPRWEGFVYPGPGNFDDADVGASVDYTFYKSGTYEFVCGLHLNMTGVIEVTGEDKDIPVETPTPTPTATPTVTATATASPTPVPTPDPHTNTPAPTPDADTVKPTLSGVSLKGRKRAAKLSFKLSEDATVTVQVRKRGSKKVLRAVTLQARAGTRSYVIRSSKLRKGRYTVTLVARDAMGNKSAAANAALRIRK